MKKNLWKESDIYQVLKTRETPESASVLNLIENPLCMDTIETILDSSNTIPKDFTLHDSAHSFRVAQRMWSLIPDETKTILSEYELFLLLMSAYLHDIGMSPKFSDVENHYSFLTTKKKDTLNVKEIDSFQKWIDENSKISPIDIKTDSISDIDEINYTLSYYIRHKHNDWSGKWIEENLNLPLKNYVNWKSDLIKICKSHHWGIDELKNDSFNPIPIGDKTVHLRYLAICLRVADVLENDPERTPDVIFNHRSISKPSEVYWLKDRYFQLTMNGNKFSIYARPEKAFLHKAIEETAIAIENELKLAKQLIVESPLNFSSYGNNIEGYEWCYEADILKDIKPKEDSYEYIQGAFRPNTKKILELLGGNQLYGNPIWAIRELLQNSFDAIKEKIALSILNEGKDPHKWIEKFGNFNEINLTIDKRNDGYWMVCKDSGVGMTKSIITDYFLTSGNNKRHEIIELERRCKKQSFNLGRTGQFGIGVLSYFMVAERIVVSTKRAQNTNYDDSNLIGWRFDINGLHDFGELKRLSGNFTGTKIELKLRPELIKDISQWKTLVKNFINSNIVKSPCELSLNCAFDNEYGQDIGCGWFKTSREVKAQVVKQLEHKLIMKADSDDIISSKEQNLINSNRSITKESLTEVNDIIEFLYEEGELPDGTGRYRIHIPYFKLKEGNSLFYLKENIVSKEHEILKINKGYYFLPNFNSYDLSLKGFSIRAGRNSMYSNFRKFGSKVHMDKYKNVFVEIDLESIADSSVAVSRHEMFLEEKFNETQSIIFDKIEALFMNHTSSFANKYSSLNSIIYDFPSKENYWGFMDENKNVNNHSEPLIWKKIELPIASDNYFLDYYTSKKFDNKPLNQIKIIKEFGENNRISWFKHYKNYTYELGVLMDNNELVLNTKTLLPIAVNGQIENEHIIKRIQIPTEWNQFFLFSMDDYSFDKSEVYLNTNYKLFEFFDDEIFLEVSQAGINIETSEIEKGPQYCYAFLINCILNYQNEKWIGLCEMKKQIVSLAFEKLGITTLHMLLNHGQVIKIELENWEIIYNTETLEKLMEKNLPPSNYITYSDSKFQKRKKSSI
jgi:hypothetical protein